jgi:1,4-alpha-glucan branching enzyme
MAKKASKKQVEFVLRAPKARSVSVGGDFNSWNPKTVTAKRDNDGAWKARLNLSPGRYQYKFLVDGQWLNDPNCNTTVPNSFGTLNCVIDVK